jgi:hypothetical protein
MSNITADIIIKKSEDIEVLLEGLDQDSINSILQKWAEIVEVRRKIDQLEEMLKMKAKVFLKERGWDKYSDPKTKVSVSVSMQKREDIDKQQLKLLLSDAQLAQVTRTITFEKIILITPEARERLKKYVQTGKR